MNMAVHEQSKLECGGFINIQCTQTVCVTNANLLVQVRFFHRIRICSIHALINKTPKFCIN